MGTSLVGGSSDDGLALLQFITQMKQQKQEVEHKKALTLLNTLRPGETLASVPGALKAFKTATGIEGDPNRILSEETLAHLMDQHDVKTVLGMPTSLQVALSQNRVLNQATGTTGPQTIESYKTGQRTAGTKARIQDTIAATTEQSLGKMSPAQRKAVSERIGLGETAATTVANEETAVAQGKSETAKAKVTDEQAKVVEEFYKDPDNSNFGKLLEKHGINATAAAQAFASGQGTLMTGVLSIEQEKISQAGQTQRKGMEIQGELTKALNQGRIDAAKKFNELTGIPVMTTLAIENAIETGANPFDLKVPKEHVHAYIKAKQLGMAGYMREQAEKNNPKLKLLGQLTENAKTFAKDPKLMTAYNTLAGQTIAETVTEGELGMPRPDTPGELQDLWDERVRFNYNTFGMVGKDTRSFLGMDWAWPDKVNSDSTVSFRATHSVTKPKKPGAQPAGFPDSTETDSVAKFQSPDAAKAVSQMTGWLQDSTLIKR